MGLRPLLPSSCLTSCLYLILMMQAVLGWSNEFEVAEVHAASVMAAVMDLIALRDRRDEVAIEEPRD